jgi:signal peptidase I
MNLRLKLLVGFAAAVPVAVVILRLLGLVIPYGIPGNSMAPTIEPGDRDLMEGFSYLLHKPKRGDVVVFEARNLDILKDGVRYVKRVAGLPGEEIYIRDGQLCINDKVVELINGAGRIEFSNPPSVGNLTSSSEPMKIPADCYFLLGDNSTNSLDSRYFGCVSRKLIKGKIAFCYWPLSRAGAVQ